MEWKANGRFENFISTSLARGLANAPYDSSLTSTDFDITYGTDKQLSCDPHNILHLDLVEVVHFNIVGEQYFG